MLLRKLTIAALILMGTVCLTTVLLIVFGVIPQFSQWTNALLLLATAILFGVAVAEIHAHLEHMESERISRQLHLRAMARRTICHRS